MFLSEKQLQLRAEKLKREGHWSNQLRSFVLFVAAKHHFSVLRQQCDPIETIRPGGGSDNLQDQSLLSWHFLLPLLVVITTTFYGNVGLQLEAGLPVDWADLLSSPFVLFHQVIAPPSIWQQMDVGLGLDVLISVGVYWALLQTAPISGRFRLYSVDGRLFVGSRKVELSKKEAGEIASYRKNSKGTFEGGVLFFLCLLYLFLYANLFINDKYQTHLLAIVFWLTLFPLFMFYLVYALFGPILFIQLSSKSLRIRQRGLLERLGGLIKGVEDKVTKQNLKSIQRPDAFYWAGYRELNRSLVHTCSMVEEYNRFCWPLLTALFPYYILVQCYLVYALLFQNGLSSHQVPVFGVAILNCNAALFFVCQQCAGVYRHSLTLEGENRRFYYRFFSNSAFGNGTARKRGVTIADMIKVVCLFDFLCKLSRNFCLFLGTILSHGRSFDWVLF